MPENIEEKTREQDVSASENVASSRADAIRQLVDTLVEHYQEANRDTPESLFLGGHPLKLYTNWLANAYAHFRKASNQELALNLASEWVLDNYYVIQQALLQIGKDLPASYYKQLPKLVDGPLKGLPRIYAIACGVLSSENYLLNVNNLQTILLEVQENVRLTMGEIWALPIFLRYSLIETLAHALKWIIRPGTPPTLPDLPPQLFGIPKPFDTGQDGMNESMASGIVANIVLSLRAISEQDWNDFFESVSWIERTLRDDPAEVYPSMDFKTRDRYRKEIESLAFASGREESDLAEALLELARKNSESEKFLDNLLSHIGEYLFGTGRTAFEKQLGYRPNAKTTIKRWGATHANTLYLGSIFLLALLIFVPILFVIGSSAFFLSNYFTMWLSVAILTFALLVPALTVSSSLVNWLVTFFVKPRILPKLSFKDGIPASFQTLVAIPTIIASREDVDNLTLQLEMHYLRNPEPGLRFAMLTDFPDAESESLPDDEELVEYAIVAIERLNAKYQLEPASLGAASQIPLFYLLHRKRLWNPSEGQWMGWERKRGKLHELNRLLRGGKDLSFSTVTGGEQGLAQLQAIHFVITLDTDTILPNGAARRLAGTLAHPLNRARFSDGTGHVDFGYTILQPRMEIHPRSANRTWFTRIFAGDTGLDLYTLAVSDTYQDLFGEGSYVGKGIYDVDAFERSVDNHIPENSVLSHDLLEGIMGRAGLVTDITMVEDYPPNYIVQVKRQKRWIRGDWQLLPWLVWPRRFGVKFSVLDRWKMIDNLLRAMLAPALLLIFFLGIIAMPHLARMWLGIVLLSLGIPVLTGMARSTLQSLRGDKASAAFYPTRWSLARWLIAVAFLPYEAYSSLDAILTTLYRLFISRRYLLQWTTAAQTAHLLGLEVHRSNTRLKLIVSALLTWVLIGAIQLAHNLTNDGISPALLVVWPALVLWTSSPFLDYWLNQPTEHRAIPLTEDQIALFRQVARRTWGFFERFVGPEDHWLPPDHYQESPAGIIAHHTSPSNIGLLLTSTLGAYDLGYLDQLGLATRLSTTLDTLDQLERYRGHFFNWYDTVSLRPLNPRYVSTVDSGNLAACLIIIAQASRELPGQRVFRWELWQGYLDTLTNLNEILAGMPKTQLTGKIEQIDQRITEMSAQILALRSDTSRWYRHFQIVTKEFWPNLSNDLIDVIKTGRTAFTLEALRRLQEAAAHVERHHQAIQQTLTELTPWIPLLEQPPELFQHPRFSQAMNGLRENLPYNPPLERIDPCIATALASITLLRDQLTDAHIGQGDLLSGVQKWLDEIEQAITQARTNSTVLLEKFSQITIRSERFINEMDFRFLYHPQRRVFHNGYNLDAGQLDNNYYDLLASEARIASIIAIAKGDAPQAHWLQLSRPLTKVEGEFVLLSWSATMFEYLMPPLFLHSYPGTLLADSAQGAVLCQVAYGKEKNVPWGISEAGFYRFDTNQNYQYRAFGVPGLGFKRGLGDDLVIAPYASLMAVGYDAHAVAENLVDLMAHNSFGLYGLYESIDFTSNRLDIGDISEVVQEYMSHHQGMIMMALVNYFHNDIMVQRMHADPRIQSVELLLQEQVPQAAPLQNPSADGAKGIQRITSSPAVITPWSVPVTTAIPQVNLLSNGSYSVLLSNMGGGYSTWKGTDLTRWQADGVLDSWGSWVYIQDLAPAANAESPKVKEVWSAGFQPIPPDNPSNVQVTYFGHMSVFRRTENGITSTMEVTVSPDDPVEIRRIHLHNMHNRLRRLRLTSYGEVILNQQATDTRHPAFNKLFIESEFVPALNLQIFKRRPRSDEETPVFLAHILVEAPRSGIERLDGHRKGTLAVRHEADRNRFIGRGRTFRNPAALFTKQYLTGTSGATLDPIFALGQEVELHPHETAELAFLTFAGESREDILALAGRYFTWSLIEHSFHQADMATQAWLGNQSYDSSTFKDTLQVLSALLYPFKAVRAAPETLTANRLGQPGLWPFGISGDYPILLVELDDSKQIELVQQVLQVYEFLRSRRFMADIVILNRQRTDYGAELNGIIYRLLTRLKFDQWLNKRGGIFILYMDQIKPDEYTLLQTAARFIFSGSRGPLDKQMPQYPLQVHHLPEFIPTRTGDAIPSTTDPLPTIEPLQFFNDYGGFSASGREYVIELIPGKPTPAPWINVIGYPHFGFMVSESGSQSTWAINSGENRLTPWSNDPVSDPTGEALYLRDEETGEVWTPTPLPAGAGQPYRVTHGAGYTIFEHHSHGLRQQLTLFASPEDPVKIIHLHVKNVWNHTRRITATQYIEWVLGTTHAASMQYIVPEYYEAESCLLATNPASTEFGERAAFLIASKPVHGLTADKTEFFGRGGNPASPAALHRLGLETRLTPGEDPCAVLQLHLDLLPGASEEIYFVLGQGNNKEHALELARKYHTPAYVGAALERTRVFWDYLLDAVKVHTPNPATDLLLNRWLLYQSLSCRVWGRSAFYQPSGAFGFRDQLQDILGALHSDPAISRGQILNAARRQFTEGDVLHWWHPPSGRGVRTRISDNLLWLPYVTALYVEATGDQGILDERVPFLDAPPLKKDENERYNQYPETRESYSLMDHCQRAIQKGMTTGPHGLPLIGAGDWNDGYNRVGIEGKGESIWLAWFLCDVMDHFAGISELRGDNASAQDYRDWAKKYAAAVESSAWDGAWYRRAYYDDGSPLGSIQDIECQIDAIAQSWAVLSNLADPQHSRQAMQSVLEKLVLPDDRLSLLFTPPFDKIERDPGYIKGYLPGIRENGGQYTHAAIWNGWAFAHLGDGKQAGALFDLLNPIFHADSKAKADEYRVEPYVMCADIYSREPYLRRGGWTWYTGSAAWMYRLGIEAILGIKRMGDKLKIVPCIPPEWPGYEVSYRFGNSHYEISVENPHNIVKGVQEVLLDGNPLADGLIPLTDDGQMHKVKVTLK